MKAFIATSLLIIIVLLSGCLGSSNSSIAPTVAFMYAIGTGDNGIHGFNQLSTGDLGFFAISSFATAPRPVAIAVHPSHNFLYVPNLTSNTVSGFNIDHTAGVLTPIGTAVPPSPACANAGTCANPIGAGVDSAGHFLYLLNQGTGAPSSIPATISVFSIDATRGLLTPIAGSPFPFASLTAPTPQFIATSPNSAFFFVSNGTTGTVSAFSIGTSGAPTEVAGSPFTVGAGANVTGLAIDPKGQILYAADSANNKVAAFTITNGVLAPVAGSPFAAGTTPVSIAVDSSSTFVYAANKGSGDISAYKSSSGVLTPIAGSPFTSLPAGTVGTPQPSFVTIDLTNSFLYVANTDTSSISAFFIKPSDGTLTQITNSPFGVGIGVTWMAITK